MILSLPNEEHVQVYSHSGRIWIISSKGIVQPLPYDVAKTFGAEIHSLARAGLRQTAFRRREQAGATE
jgi:hypothetical protein